MRMNHSSLVGMTSHHHKALSAALEWYVDHGVDEILSDKALDRRKPVETASISALPEIKQKAEEPPAAVALGKSDARAEAIKLAGEAHSLEELKEAIASFDGLAVKKTATNMVFSDGNPEAPIMLVGEAPGADEDRQGKPFVGVSGQLLDRIFNSIDLDRTEDTPEKSVYISNILNWRPPGNRTPSQAEVEVSLPFIERHIILAKPKILILCGGVAAKGLLGRSDSISRMRKTWHDYKPLTQEFQADCPSISAIATYHPAFLLRTPSQKRAVWNDMLMLVHKLKELNIR